MKKVEKKTENGFTSFLMMVSEIAEVSMLQAKTSLAYQGNRQTEIKLDEATGKLLGSAIVAEYLSKQGFSFAMAEAIDGTIVRLFSENAEETFRFFLSKRECYKGKFGVSGKARAMLEMAGNSSFDWHQQGMKNYWYSSNFASLFSFLRNQ